MRISDWSSDVCSSDLSHGWAPRSLRSRSCHERPAAEAEEGKEEGRSGKSDGKAENDLNQAAKPARGLAKGKREAGRDDDDHGDELRHWSMQNGRASCRERVCQ